MHHRTNEKTYAPGMCLCTEGEGVAVASENDHLPIKKIRRAVLVFCSLLHKRGAAGREGGEEPMPGGQISLTLGEQRAFTGKKERKGKCEFGGRGEGRHLSNRENCLLHRKSTITGTGEEANRSGS